MLQNHIAAVLLVLNRESEYVQAALAFDHFSFNVSHGKVLFS